MYTREAKEEYSVMFEPGDTCHMHTLTRANLPRAHQHHPTLPVHTQLVHSYTPQMSHSATMQVNWAREFHFTVENLNVFCGWWNLIMLLLSIVWLVVPATDHIQILHFCEWMRLTLIGHMLPILFPRYLKIAITQLNFLGPFNSAEIQTCEAIQQWLPWNTWWPRDNDTWHSFNTEQSHTLGSSASLL